MQTLDQCRELSDAGGKVRALAELSAAGFAVLPGVVVMPGDDLAQMATRAALLRAVSAMGASRLVVRSSSTGEDVSGGSAAGIFVSKVDVLASERPLLDAIAEVRASAQSETARNYLAPRGVDVAQQKMAVLIQPLVNADWLGVANMIDDAPTFLIEERLPSEPEWGVIAKHERHARDATPLCALLTRVAKKLGGYIEVEFARTGEKIWILQARPTPPPPKAPDFTQVDLAGHFRLDGDHNPLPISEAQAGLVQWVQPSEAPQQLVIGGYLYDLVHTQTDTFDASTIAQALPALENFPTYFREKLVAPLDELFSFLEMSEPLLEDALSAHRRLSRTYRDEISPVLKYARAAFDHLLASHEAVVMKSALLQGLGGRTRERDEALWALRQAADHSAEQLAPYLERFGAYSPVWDVAVATDDEDQARVWAGAASLTAPSPTDRYQESQKRFDVAYAATVARLDESARENFTRVLTTLREIMAIAEDDDWLYYRAQRLVRRALLWRGWQWKRADLLQDATQIFDVPLEFARQLKPKISFTEIAKLNHARFIEAKQFLPPHEIIDGKPLFPTLSFDRALRGYGTFGKARGRAFVIRDVTQLPQKLPPGSVLVVPALVPAISHLLTQAVALVSDFGGATSHGATLAREYGVPAVVGTRVATQLVTGAILHVDADIGTVLVIEEETKR